VDADPPIRERQRDPTGADRELQRRTATCQLLQEGDGRQLIPPWDVVVPVGDVLPKAHHRLVVLHNPILTFVSVGVYPARAETDPAQTTVHPSSLAPTDRLLVGACAVPVQGVR
jgi:hypothetical protein